MDGRIGVKFSAAAPGSPRPPIDGQLFAVIFTWGTGVPADVRGVIAIRIFDARAMVASPRWADVRDIWEQYARLYPAMSRIGIDMSVHSVVQTMRAALEASMVRPIDHPRYMPVTRDLSRDKKALLLRWLRAGAPM
jgi:hypothetical protein